MHARGTGQIIDTIQGSFHIYVIIRRVWRYQRGTHNPYMEEEQTTQWPKEKVQNDKNTIYKTYI